MYGSTESVRILLYRLTSMAKGRGESPYRRSSLPTIATGPKKIVVNLKFSGNRPRRKVFFFLKRAFLAFCSIFVPYFELFQTIQCGRT